jgi:hypothetical protein
MTAPGSTGFLANLGLVLPGVNSAKYIKLLGSHQIGTPMAMDPSIAMNAVNTMNEIKSGKPAMVFLFTCPFILDVLAKEAP